VTGLKRVLHLASFALSSTPVVLWKALTFRPDVVITVEPAAMCMPGAWIAARICGAKCWLHVQDFEVDAAFDLGILKQPLLRRIVLAAEAFLMRRFDRVSSISPNMLLKLVQKGVDESRVVAFPNWVDCDVMKPLAGGDGRAQEKDDRPPPLPSHCLHLRARFGIPEDKFIALYAGNIGKKQGLEIVARAAELLGETLHGEVPRRETVATGPGRDDRPVVSPRTHPEDQGEPGDRRRREVHFVICGQGASLESLRRQVQGLANVQLLPPQPIEAFNELMNCADVHLLPQLSGAADLVMPSKLTGMLASGRPVVASADPGTQIADVVRDHGLVTPPGAAADFAAAIESLAGDPQRCAELGRAARQYAVDHLSAGAILRRFAEELEELVASG